MNQDLRHKEQEEYLKNIVLYKITFPDFWGKAYTEKNEFYQKILKQAQEHVNNFPNTKEYLEGEKIQLFWHEHCDFCYEKAMANTKCEFYCTKDMNYWVCQKCFEEFQNQFNWVIKSADEIFD